MTSSEEKKIQATSAGKWHPNAPLNPNVGGDQPETDFQCAQDRPHLPHEPKEEEHERPASCPDIENVTQVVPPVAESDDSVEHQWSATRH